MSLINKIVGSIIVLIGFAMFYIDYLVFSAIGALALWVATEVGAIGAAATGIQVIAWILTLSAMLSIAVFGCMVIAFGLTILSE